MAGVVIHHAICTARVPETGTVNSRRVVHAHRPGNTFSPAGVRPRRCERARRAPRSRPFLPPTALRRVGHARRAARAQVGARSRDIVRVGRSRSADRAWLIVRARGQCWRRGQLPTVPHARSWVALASEAPTRADKCQRSSLRMQTLSYSLNICYVIALKDQTIHIRIAGVDAPEVHILSRFSCPLRCIIFNTGSPLWPASPALCAREPRLAPRSHPRQNGALPAPAT